MTVVHADGVRVYPNPRAAARDEPYGAARAAILDESGFAAAQREISSWPDYAPTPLHRLPGLAARLGLAELRYKDEGGRFGLKSFKALGGAYAVFRLLKAKIEARNGGRAVTSAQIIAGEWREVASGGHRHLRDRRQPRSLGRLGRAALRLPLRHLHPPGRQRRAARGDRALRRRGDPGRRETTTIRCATRPPKRRGTAGPSCPTRPTKAIGTFRSM